MDILEALESRIDLLLTQLMATDEENRRLKEELSGFSQLEEENRKLRDELHQEQANRDAVLARIDNLLGRLAEFDPDTEDT